LWPHPADDVSPRGGGVEREPSGGIRELALTVSGLSLVSIAWAPPDELFEEVRSLPG
jgi:hypothetical protein